MISLLCTEQIWAESDARCSFYFEALEISEMPSDISMNLITEILKDDIEEQHSSASPAPHQRNHSARSTWHRHKLFVQEDGELIFMKNPKELEDPYFAFPDTETAPPRIVLRSLDDLTNGTYHHELDHFMKWYRTKNRLLRLGYSQARARMAESKLAATSPFHDARSAQYYENSATDPIDTYAQFEAIRRLPLQELKNPQSPTSQRVRSYVREAYRKIILERDLDIEIETELLQERLLETAHELQQTMSSFQEKDSKTRPLFAELTSRVSNRLFRFFFLRETITHALILDKNFRLERIFEPALMSRIEDQADRDSLENFIRLRRSKNITGRASTPFSPRSQTVLDDIQYLKSIEMQKWRTQFKDALSKVELPTETKDQISKQFTKAPDLKTTALAIEIYIEKLKNEPEVKAATNLVELDLNQIKDLKTKQLCQTLVELFKLYVRIYSELAPIDLSPQETLNIASWTVQEQQHFFVDYKKWKKTILPMLVSSFVFFNLEIMWNFKNSENEQTTNLLLKVLELKELRKFIKTQSQSELNSLDSVILR